MKIHMIRIIAFMLITSGLSSGIEQSSDDTEIKNGEIIQSISEMFRKGKELLLSNIGIKVAGKLFHRIPGPEQIFNFAKQTLIGFPQEVIAYTVHLICSTAANINVIRPEYTPNIQNMNFLLITPDKHRITIPLLRPYDLWTNEKFRMNWKILILITGWNSNINTTNDALETLYKAYAAARDDYNFIVIDTATYVNSLYTWSAFNTEAIGEIIGEALVTLMEYTKLQDIHLIGHSLGAHICGVAGRTFRKLTNRILPRITGLDPARPCFGEGHRLNNLQRGDAAFVDIIHTNADILGISESIGDVDFYPNGQDALQPGCWTITCAHARAYQFYAETIYPGNEMNFIATQCNSITNYKLGYCYYGRNVSMGLLTPSWARGNYYLITNKHPPFGRNSNQNWS